METATKSVCIPTVQFMMAMHAYQQNQVVKNRCLQNVSYMLDSADTDRQFFRALPVMAVYRNTRNQFVAASHVVLCCRDTGEIMDPTYDVAKHKPVYARSLREFQELVGSRLSEQQRVRYAGQLVKLSQACDEMNEGVTIVSVASEGPASHAYYHAQAAYVHKTILEYVRVMKW
jgi:hypothetical protein